MNLVHLFIKPMNREIVKWRLGHLLHCLFSLCSVISLTILIDSISRRQNEDEDLYSFDPRMKYRYLGYYVLYSLRFLILFSFPEVLLSFVGLTFYGFPGKVNLKISSLPTCLISIRVVTRGDFPKLVRQTVIRNLACCTKIGLKNFIIEVVTDKPIGLPSHPKIREIVVPVDYTTKTGALYKARALQYCLEDRINILADDDWIVHLDEETLLTENSLHGILNFVSDGKHEFGHGLITYTNENVVNWITTLVDVARVADDLGKFRGQFKLFRKPLVNWKGSFIIARVSAEREVSFECGLNGSLTEDLYFGLKASMTDYSFDYVEGEMWEKSPFSLWDFIQQRKRWLEGNILVIQASEIPIRYKFLMILSTYAWFSKPILSCNLILSTFYPAYPLPDFLRLICSFTAGVGLYGYLCGIVASFRPFNEFGLFRFVVCTIGSICAAPLKVALECLVLVLVFFDKNRQFYIVKKDI